MSSAQVTVMAQHRKVMNNERSYSADKEQSTQAKDNNRHLIQSEIQNQQQDDSGKRD